MAKQVIAIVGAGLAGLAAVEALRQNTFDGKIILIGEEPHLPYTRPPLSKAVLRGESASAATALRPGQWYEDNDVDLALGVRAIQVKPHSQEIELADGRSVRYDKVLIATGGRAKTLRVEGAELPGVHTLRTIEDAEVIRESLVPGAPVVIIGAGFIGAEVAASARLAGCEVTVLEVAEEPMSRVLGPELGNFYAEVHRSRGVNLQAGVGLYRIEGDTRVRRVVATDGRHHDASLVVLGVGIEPDVDPVVGAGIGIGNGIEVNEFCETAVPGVFAAGDVAFHPNPILGRTLRIEQWQNAQHQGAAAARCMLGQREPFAEVPWFWSDQYDINLQVAGVPEHAARAVFRGDVDGLRFSVFYLRDGVLDGVVGINRVADVRTGRVLIHKRARTTAEVLADESVDLKELARNI